MPVKGTYKRQTTGKSFEVPADLPKRFVGAGDDAQRRGAKVAMMTANGKEASGHNGGTTALYAEMPYIAL